MRKLDDTNMEIIRHLRDGRKAYAAIADELDITENTVRSRANKLVDDKVLSFRGLVNPEYMPSLQIAIMGIKVSTMDLEKKAQELSKLRGVINCCIVTGKEQAELARKMDELSKAYDAAFLMRDAGNIRISNAVVLVGVKNVRRGLDSLCGYCGFDDCAACTEAGAECVYGPMDLGIAAV